MPSLCFNIKGHFARCFLTLAFIRSDIIFWFVSSSWRSELVCVCVCILWAECPRAATAVNWPDAFIKAATVDKLCRMYIQYKYFQSNECQTMPWKITSMPEALHLHTPNPRLIFSPSTLGPFSVNHTSRPESLPSNKIISSNLLMSQNYIKSLKVNEHGLWMIYFRGSIGSKPKHFALLSYTPRQENAPGYKIHFQHNH